MLIYYHGGGFCIHNIASHDSLCRKLALDCGCAVLSVGYRLAPEGPFPAAVEDCYTALTWLRDNAPPPGAGRQPHRPGGRQRRGLPQRLRQHAGPGSERP